ncbi:hypothetical protein HanHA300_Chr15g0547691 [Helianthus annuus]|nr:hypothetical protein HanHA300_Chr15g0547691 [Helianthus annuus]KAJ0650843.1 hypothetical protein HanOQP8_Chr15g0554711 [Helianthus annuus]
MMKATALIKMRMMVVCRLSSDRRNDDGSDDATLPSTSSGEWIFVVVMSTAVMVVAVVKLFRVNLVHSFHELIWFRFGFESTGQRQSNMVKGRICSSSGLGSRCGVESTQPNGSAGSTRSEPSQLGST